MTKNNQRPSLIEPYIYAALRIVSGFLFFLHGTPKTWGWIKPGAVAEPFTQMWFGGWIEVIAGLCIALGLLTRPMAFLASGTMAVAYFQVHFQFKFADHQWIPFVNKGEPAVLFCFIFLLIFARGSGPLSLRLARK